MIILYFARYKEDDFVPTEMKHLTSAQVQKILHCGKNKLKPLRESGELIFFKTGRFSYSYPPEQFTAAFIKQRQSEKQNFGLKKGK